MNIKDTQSEYCIYYTTNIKKTNNMKFKENKPYFFKYKNKQIKLTAPTPYEYEVDSCVLTIENGGKINYISFYSLLKLNIITTEQYLEIQEHFKGTEAEAYGYIHIMDIEDEENQYEQEDYDIDKEKLIKVGLL